MLLLKDEQSSYDDILNKMCRKNISSGLHEGSSDSIGDRNYLLMQNKGFGHKDNQYIILMDDGALNLKNI